MKKTLTLIAICLTTSLFAQLEHMNISNVITFDANNYNSQSTTITVPEGKWWVISTNVFSSSFKYFNAKFNGFSDFELFPFYKIYDANYGHINNYFFLTEGTEIYFSIPNTFTYVMQIWEYDAPSSQTGTLAYEEIEDTLNKGIKLFPNPTTSKIALNSNKDYKIEIFDMVGNKVMETSGNTIDMSILSSAMYIVKAFDKATKETESYKVVKN
jgi:hypothetical protein